MSARRSTAHNGDGNWDGGVNQTEIPAIVEVSDDLTSQSRHSLLLQGSPPSGKLLIPNGEMSEWLKEHAWKAKRASDIKALPRASTHTRPAT